MNISIQISMFCEYIYIPKTFPTLGTHYAQLGGSTVYKVHKNTNTFSPFLYT